MYKVFIVDDERMIAKGLEKIVDWNSLGCTAQSFTSSMTAYESALREHPDILITDIKMPDMDGLELAGKLKEAHFKTVVIILSGFSDFAYAKKGIELGVNTYILKPVELEELKSAVTQAITRLEEQDSIQRELQKMRVLYENRPANLRNLQDIVDSEQHCSANDDLIETIKEYIDTHFTQNISLPAVSEHFFMNPSYLSQLFKKKTGYTYISYLTNKRIEKAKLLLMRNVKVYEVCHSVGYENVKHFSKTFEKVVGVKPSAYKGQINSSR